MNIKKFIKRLLNGDWGLGPIPNPNQIIFK